MCARLGGAWTGKGGGRRGEEFEFADASAILQKRLRAIPGAALALLGGPNAQHATLAML